MLAAYLFARLDKAGDITTSWQEENNADHPHESLHGLRPYEYAKSVHLQMVLKMGAWQLEVHLRDSQQKDRHPPHLSRGGQPVGAGMGWGKRKALDQLPELDITTGWTWLEDDTLLCGGYRPIVEALK